MKTLGKSMSPELRFMLRFRRPLPEVRALLIPTRDPAAEMSDTPDFNDKEFRSILLLAGVAVSPLEIQVAAIPGQSGEVFRMEMLVCHLSCSPDSAASSTHQRKGKL